MDEKVFFNKVKCVNLAIFHLRLCSYLQRKKILLLCQGCIIFWGKKTGSPFDFLGEILSGQNAHLLSKAQARFVPECVL